MRWRLVVALVVVAVADPIPDLRRHGEGRDARVHRGCDAIRVTTGVR